MVSLPVQTLGKCQFYRFSHAEPSLSLARTSTNGHLAPRLYTFGKQQKKGTDATTLIQPQVTVLVVLQNFVVAWCEALASQRGTSPGQYTWEFQGGDERCLLRKPTAVAGLGQG